MSGFFVQVHSSTLWIFTRGACTQRCKNCSISIILTTRGTAQIMLAGRHLHLAPLVRKSGWKLHRAYHSQHAHCRIQNASIPVASEHVHADCHHPNQSRKNWRSSRKIHQWRAFSRARVGIFKIVLWNVSPCTRSQRRHQRTLRTALRTTSGDRKWNSQNPKIVYLFHKFVALRSSKRRHHRTCPILWHLRTTIEWILTAHQFIHRCSISPMLPGVQRSLLHVGVCAPRSS